MPIEKGDGILKSGETSAASRATPARTTVRIPTASGDDLEAWLYLPEGRGPHPAVVMAHGIGAIKAGGLAPFAERFCREGFAAVVFDYRQWGGSDGQPDRKSTRLNSSHPSISYAVFCLKKKK